MQEEERYLGGSYSPLQLSIGRFGVGAGVYEEPSRHPFAPDISKSYRPQGRLWKSGLARRRSTSGSSGSYNHSNLRCSKSFRVFRLILVAESVLLFGRPLN